MTCVVREGGVIAGSSSSTSSSGSSSGSLTSISEAVQTPGLGPSEMPESGWSLFIPCGKAVARKVRNVFA